MYQGGLHRGFCIGDYLFRLTKGDAGILGV